MDKLKKVKWGSLAFYVLFPIMLSFIVAMLIPDYKDYYEGLEKIVSVPWFVFPIVWTILYILMGISSYIADENKTSKNSLKLYYIQLSFNLSWSIIFFWLKMINLGILWILIIITLLIMVMKEYRRVSKVSFYLLIPYLLWLIFALILNISISILN